MSVYLLMKIKKASKRVLKDKKSSKSTIIAVDPAKEMPIGTPTRSNTKSVDPRAIIIKSYAKKSNPTELNIGCKFNLFIHIFSLHKAYNVFN